MVQCRAERKRKGGGQVDGLPLCLLLDAQESRKPGLSHSHSHSQESESGAKADRSLPRAAKSAVKRMVGGDDPVVLVAKC
jgi:hypothetical protein